MDQITEQFLAKATLKLRWRDPRLAWNPLEWGGVTHVYQNILNIWMPDYRVVLNADMSGIDGDSNALVHIDSTGSVNFVTNLDLAVYHEFQLFYWPFDTQNIEIRFRSFNLWRDQLVFMPMSAVDPDVEDVTVGKLMEHSNQFKLEGVETQVGYAAEGGQEYSWLSARVRVGRLTMKFNSLLFWPSLMMCVLSWFNILMKSENFKINNALAIVLVVAVYLTVINNYLPDSKSTLLFELSYLSMYICTFINCISCFLTYFVDFQQHATVSKLSAHFGAHSLHNEDSLAYKVVLRLGFWVKLGTDLNQYVCLGVIYANLLVYVVVLYSLQASLHPWLYTACTAAALLLLSAGLYHMLNSRINRINSLEVIYKLVNLVRNNYISLYEEINYFYSHSSTDAIEIQQLKEILSIYFKKYNFETDNTNFENALDLMLLNYFEKNKRYDIDSLIDNLNLLIYANNVEHLDEEDEQKFNALLNDRRKSTELRQYDYD